MGDERLEIVPGSDHATIPASALINAARNTGGSIGVSLVSNVLTHREQFHQSRLVEQYFRHSPPTRGAIT